MSVLYTKINLSISNKLSRSNICAISRLKSSIHLKDYKFPSFVTERAAMFDRLKKEYDNWLAEQPREPIKITLPDGKIIDGISWETTPYKIASEISNRLADNAIISKVNNVLWDLKRPLEENCSLEILDFESDDGKQVFWHSSAHILGEAMEGNYHGCLCYGPPIENGFYYDMYMDGKLVSSNDFKMLEQFCSHIVKDKQDFVRLEMSKEDLLKMFHYNPFKLRIINEKITETKTTVYKCGPLIDLCRGPHVINTNKIKSLALIKNSSTYWEGNQKNESLQRIYGISFPDNKKMKEWKILQEEAAKRDHRKIGREHELFFFNELSPGSCFFLPKGAYIYNTLMEFIRNEYHTRGYSEVISPNVFNIKLWETSGHWQHYSENMFSFEVEKDIYALKPMNCPGHCVMFSNRSRSWRELPIRFADFGVLHRNELSGTLSGLTRVRRFCQDDAHIFCTVEQLKDEIHGCLDFVNRVYGVLGFSMKINLSTRPEKFLGSIEIWDRAEKELEEALNKNGHPWILNPGDGAFYGPKIDIHVCDALNRYHQCGTVQCDFQLPERFNLNYMAQDGTLKRPVIVHRAILGSLERMIAILTENFAGKWPFWLSPNQIVILPVNPNFDDYALCVKKQFYDHKFNVELHSDPSETLNKRIRNAQRAQFNFILVVGEQEKESNTASVRSRDNIQHGQRPISELIAIFESLRREKIRDESFKFPAN